MPAKTEKQKNFFKVVLAYKKGKIKNVSKEVKKAANSMSEKQIKDFLKDSITLDFLNKETNFELNEIFKILESEDFDALDIENLTDENIDDIESILKELDGPSDGLNTPGMGNVSTPSNGEEGSGDEFTIIGCDICNDQFKTEVKKISFKEKIKKIKQIMGIEDLEDVESVFEDTTKEVILHDVLKLSKEDKFYYKIENVLEKIENKETQFLNKIFEFYTNSTLPQIIYAFITLEFKDKNRLEQFTENNLLKIIENFKNFLKESLMKEERKVLDFFETDPFLYDVLENVFREILQKVKNLN